MMNIMKQFEHLKIQLEAIESATNNFAEDNCIGKGGFGRVYKGELVQSKGRTVVAIKKLDRAFGQGNPEFWKEIIMLSLYRHENIVSLLGFCDDRGEKILVYEYSTRRSLDLYLNSNDLTWVRRLKICIGAATGLAYLHNPVGTQQRVLHRDIKSSNILLDEDWNARIADFGLSKFGPANQQYTFLVSNTVGTFGYCDPLYVETGLLTKESDVYSFGVVLFEVLCGRLSIGIKDKHEPLIGLARRCYEENTLNEIIFGNIKDEINPNSLRVFTTIAYRCLKRDREDRPLMAEIVSQLAAALKYQNEHGLEWVPQPAYSDAQIPISVDPKTTRGLDVPGHSGGVAEGYDREPIANWNSKTTPYTNTLEKSNFSDPYLPPVLEEPHSSFSDDVDDDPLPAIEDLQINGEAFPGRELQASGYSINGTTSCNFEWVRHMEDDSLSYIEGANRPTYLVTADDVDTYLAVEVQPLDDRKRKGEIVKVFANDHRKIDCDPHMHDFISKALQTGHSEHRLALWKGNLHIWEAVTLIIKKDRISINGIGNRVNEKFSPSTMVVIPCGNLVEFSIIDLGSVELRLRAEQKSARSRSSRDVIVLILRYFIKMCVEKKKAKKKSIFFWR